MAINIGRFSVNNSVLINVLMISILLLGAFSLWQLPQEQFPEIPFFWVNIIVPYPGVSAEDIENTLTIKIEKELQGLDKLKQISSVTSEGQCVVRVEFEDGISNQEFLSLFQDTRTRFSRIELPDGVLNPIIDDFSTADFQPVIEVVLWGDAGYDRLKRSAVTLRNRLLGILEVSGVELAGARDKQILVQVNKKQIDVLNIPLDLVAQAIRERNLTVPGGILETENREYLLRTSGSIEDSSDLYDVIIRQGNTQGLTDNYPLYIRNVATVQESYDPEGVMARFNGKQAITLKIAKVPRGSSIAVIDQVKQVITEFTPLLPAGLQIDLLNDSTVQIRDSIDVLLSNALMGFILLIIILLLFIGLRNALITAIGIPVTFAITFIVFQYLGETFNTSTLFGLVLVLGLIVDDAIVIVENCYRYEQQGLSKREAAIKGINQVALPVIAATLTTVAAFLPLMILPGTIGRFLRVIPLTVVIALLASTSEATLFLPSHYADWPGKTRKQKKDLFLPVMRVFEKLLKAIYKKKLLIIIIFIVIMITIFALVPFIQQDLFSAEDYTYFYIDITMPRGTNIHKTDRIVEQFEQKILPLIGNSEILSVTSYVGLSAGSNQNVSKSNVAQLVCDLTEKSEGRTLSIQQVMDRVKQLCTGIAGPERVEYRKVQTGPPVDAPVSFRLFGDNYRELQIVAQAIKDKLATYPELFDIEDDLQTGTPELKIRIKPGQAERYGLNVSTIGRFIRNSFIGIEASTFFKDNEEIDIIVKYDDESIPGIEELVQSKITTTDGRQIPFSAVCELARGDVLAAINRLDEKREVTIESKAYTEERVNRINDEISQLFNSQYKNKYPDVEFRVGGEFAEFRTLIIQILQIFLIGIFLIYLILSAQFRSYLQPLLILIAVPFAFVGVIIFLLISGTPFSTTVLYAGVALAGIAVNDSIVLISFINELKGSKQSLKHIIIQAASTRLRPIILTSLTTIAGLLPTAIGIGGVSVVWGPMASTIIFGILFSTITTLIFIPLFYGLLFDRTKKKQES